MFGSFVCVHLYIYLCLHVYAVFLADPIPLAVLMVLFSNLKPSERCVLSQSGNIGFCLPKKDESVFDLVEPGYSVNILFISMAVAWLV